MLLNGVSYPALQAGVNPPEVSVPGAGLRPTLRKMSGVKLARLLKKARTPQEKLRLAYELGRGGVVIEDPTFTQTAKFVGLSASHVHAYTRLSEDERGQLDRHEATLRQLRQRKADKPPSDAQLDAIIARAGLHAVWKAFERATAPAATSTHTNGVTNGAKAPNGNGRAL